MSATVATQPTGKTATIAAWVIQVLLAVAFLAAATAKLVGVPMIVGVFAAIGIGQWFRYVTAAVEIIGVLGLLTPGFAAPAAIWLGITMACATTVHLLILHNSPAGPVILFSLSMILLWLRRGQLSSFLARFG